MKLLIYVIFRITILLNKITPFWVIYRVSDLIYYFFYYVFPYRKKVVLANLNKAFPEKSEKERVNLSKKFYRNFCDILMESLKGFSMKQSEVIKRYRILNPEILNEYYKKKQSLIFVGAHYTNWEWGALATGSQIKHKAIGFYKPLTNKYVDKYMKVKRAAWQMNLASIYKTTEIFDEENHNTAAFLMLADQCPTNLSRAYFIKFLGLDTACLHGPERHAKRLNLPIFFIDLQRIKRGYYTAKLTKLFDKPLETKDGEITETYMRTLETIIIDKPENWLWTHKRWKRTSKDRK